MPINKNNVRLNAKHSQERIELLDNIISTAAGKLHSKDFLLKKLNQSLPKKISLSQLDKDLKKLRELIKNDGGVSLQFSQDQGYFYFPDKGYRYFTGSIDDEEKRLLLLASSLFSVFEGTPLQGKFSKVVDRIVSESITGSTVSGWTDFRLLQMENMQNGNGGKWVSVLLEAIYEKSCLKIVYKGFRNQERIKNICPYVLKQYQNRWYMVGFDYDCNRPHKTNVFALDRIIDMDISVSPYFFDESFNAEDFFKYSIGVWHWYDSTPITVELEFTNYSDAILSSPIHSSQKVLVNTDERKLIITLEVYDSPELISLINSYGSNVKVISPDSLKDKIKKDAQRVLDMY